MALATLTKDARKADTIVKVKCIALPKHLVERRNAAGEKFPGPGFNSRGVVGVKPGDVFEVCFSDAAALCERYPAGKDGGPTQFSLVK